MILAGYLFVAILVGSFCAYDAYKEGNRDFKPGNARFAALVGVLSGACWPVVVLVLLILAVVVGLDKFLKGGERS